MPKKDLVRDGRLQAPKKRTDRSYLRTPSPAAAPAAEPAEPAADPDSPDAVGSVASGLAEAPVAAVAPAPVASSPSTTATAAATAAARHTGAARALEQQGVRKRRELDVDALAKRDSDYAKHELRRIFVFATLIFAVLVLLAIFVV